MKFLFGVVAGLLILPAFAYFYLRLGYAPVATGAPARQPSLKPRAGAQIARSGT